MKAREADNNGQWWQSNQYYCPTAWLSISVCVLALCAGLKVCMQCSATKEDHSVQSFSLLSCSHSFGIWTHKGRSTNTEKRVNADVAILTLTTGGQWILMIVNALGPIIHSSCANIWWNFQSKTLSEEVVFVIYPLRVCKCRWTKHSLRILFCWFWNGYMVRGMSNWRDCAGTSNT